MQVCTTTPCVLGGCGSSTILETLKQNLGMLLYLYISRLIPSFTISACQRRVFYFFAMLDIVRILW